MRNTVAASKANITHGMTNTRVFRIWTSMKARCNNPSSISFKNYGGRGIRVCERWLNSFETFYKDMGDPPEMFVLERINNDWGYYPENCKWATVKENTRNRRSNRVFTFAGETKCITAWADSLGLTGQALHRRIDILQWPLERALTERSRYEK